MKQIYVLVLTSTILLACSAASSQDDAKEEPPIEFLIEDEKKEPESGLIQGTANTLLKHHPTQMFGRPHTINVLPIVYYDTRTGFNFGFRSVLMSREFRPYRYRLTFQLLASVLGQHKHILRFDYPDMVRGYGLSIRAEWERDLEARYFGLGNESEREEAVIDKNSQGFIDEDYYVYNLKRPRFSIHGTRLIMNDLLFLFGGGYEHVRPQIKNDNIDSFIALDKPFGHLGGWGTHLSMRLFFDSRNDDLFPTRGFVTELSYEPNFANIRVEPETGGQSNREVTFHRFTFSDAHFIPIRDTGFIFANRLAFEAIAGEAPYYSFGEIAGYRTTRSIGGSSSLRGYKSRRFQDKVRMITLTELRYNFRRFKFMSHDFRLILTAFVDNGRVWPNFGDVTFRDFHTTFGTGAWLNWNDNMIIRFDLGRSPEGFTPYFRLNGSF